MLTLAPAALQRVSRSASTPILGETERHIRLVFLRARVKASEGSPAAW
jgi:hypothetical protein